MNTLKSVSILLLGMSILLLCIIREIVGIQRLSTPRGEPSGKQMGAQARGALAALSGPANCVQATQQQPIVRKVVANSVKPRSARKCLHCQKPLSMFRFGPAQYCSNEHRQSDQAAIQTLMMERLQVSAMRIKSAPRYPENLVTETPVNNDSGEGECVALQVIGKTKRV